MRRMPKSVSTRRTSRPSVCPSAVYKRHARSLSLYFLQAHHSALSVMELLRVSTVKCVGCVGNTDVDRQMNSAH